MTMSHEDRSAEIYQFPLRGRFAAASRREESNSVPGVTASQLATTVFGSNWYHEEAIREAELAGRR